MAQSKAQEQRVRRWPRLEVVGIQPTLDGTFVILFKTGPNFGTARVLERINAILDRIDAVQGACDVRFDGTGTITVGLDGSRVSAEVLKDLAIAAKFKMAEEVLITVYLGGDRPSRIILELPTRHRIAELTDLFRGLEELDGVDHWKVFEPTKVGVVLRLVHSHEVAARMVALDMLVGTGLKLGKLTVQPMAPELPDSEESGLALVLGGPMGFLRQRGLGFDIGAMGTELDLGHRG